MGKKIIKIFLSGPTVNADDKKACKVNQAQTISPLFIIRTFVGTVTNATAS